MNHFGKMLVLCAVLLMVLTGCNYPRDWNEPERLVGKPARLIADFTVPAGFEAEFGLHALGYTAVAYHNTTSNGYLYLVQSENDADGKALANALDEMVPGYRDADGRLEVVEERPFTIRTQDVTVSISEGLDWDDEMMRQATAVFQGKAGPTLLIMRFALDAWSDETVETFLSSIR